MKYIVLETEEEYYEIDDVLNACISEDYHEDDDYFEDWVNDNYNGADINGEYYRPYDILENMDSGNLDSLREDYCRNMNEEDRDQARYELENAENGEIVDIQCYRVTVVIEETGDFDGDDQIELLRSRLKQEEEEKTKQKEQEKSFEDNFMKAFQIVGG